jgi:predicted AAA+ superfamily ATPase
MKPCEKIKYSNISSDDSARDLKSNLELLFMAQVATPVYHTQCSGIPLESTRSDKVFKPIVLDLGLMNYIQKTSWSSIKNMNEENLLTDGKIAEQFIGQHLLSIQPIYMMPSLNYWLREGKSANAEVDYILERSPYLISIEVKAGAAGKIRSMHQWVQEAPHKKKKCIRFNLSKGCEEIVTYQYINKTLSYPLMTLPLYLVERLDDFIKS